MRFTRKEHDPVERALRSGRPEAGDDFVAELGARVLVSGPRSRRGSRVAFAGALTVFMLGTFGSFGGLGYAASSVQTTASSVKKIVVPAKQTRKSVSSAQDEYGEETVPVVTKPKPKPPVEVVAGVTTSKPPSGTLPFTGYGLGGTAVLGSLFLAAGIFLRRRESRE